MRALLHAFRALDVKDDPARVGTPDVEYINPPPLLSELDETEENVLRQWMAVNAWLRDKGDEVTEQLMYDAYFEPPMSWHLKMLELLQTDPCEAGRIMSRSVRLYFLGLMEKGK